MNERERYLAAIEAERERLRQLAKHAEFQRTYGGGPNKLKDLYAQFARPEWTRPDADKKPMVTREQYDQAKAVLDALPSGFYFKCANCGGWFSGSKNGVLYPDSQGPVCQGGCDS